MDPLQVMLSDAEVKKILAMVANHQIENPSIK